MLQGKCSHKKQGLCLVTGPGHSPICPGSSGASLHNWLLTYHFREILSTLRRDLPITVSKVKGLITQCLLHEASCCQP